MKIEEFEKKWPFFDVSNDKFLSYVQELVSDINSIDDMPPPPCDIAEGILRKHVWYSFPNNHPIIDFNNALKAMRELSSTLHNKYSQH